jgi:NAD(P)H dehydrogenase (quinone)
MLYFTGFTVVEPFLVHAPARIGEDERAIQLDRYRARVRDLLTAPAIVYPSLSDYDSSYVLKSSLPA